jgi:hypothetical protein
MTHVITAALVAGAISAVGLAAQAPTPKGTERTTPREAAQARNLMEEVTAVGCIRAWKPAPADPAKQATDQKPGVPGVYLLTPVASSPQVSTDLPTYLLTPSATVNFAQHLNRRVEITGTAQAAPLPPTVQELAAAPTRRPENAPTTQSLPRLTVTSLKQVGESCP